MLMVSSDAVPFTDTLGRREPGFCQTRMSIDHTPEPKARPVSVTGVSLYLRTAAGRGGPARGHPQDVRRCAPTTLLLSVKRLYALKWGADATDEVSIHQ